MTHETLKIYIKKEIADYYEIGEQYLDLFYNDVKNAFEKLNNCNIELVLFDKKHFMKSEDSLVDSLSRRMSSFIDYVPTYSINSRELKNKFNDALDNYKDFFRMNVCVHNDSLFQTEMVNVLKMIRKMPDISLHYDYFEKNCKNSFKESSDCKDFKVYFKYKEKYPFEIQFHNDSSEKMNLATHGIYEVYRATDLKTEYKEKLGKDRKSLYKMVKTPPFDEEIIKKEGLRS